MPRQATDMVSLDEISKRIGRNRVTVKRWIRAGQFPGYMPSDGVYLVTRQMFERWLAGEWTPARKQQEDAA